MNELPSVREGICIALENAMSDERLSPKVESRGRSEGLWEALAITFSGQCDCGENAFNLRNRGKAEEFFDSFCRRRYQRLMTR